MVESYEEKAKTNMYFPFSCCEKMLEAFGVLYCDFGRLKLHFKEDLSVKRSEVLFIQLSKHQWEYVITTFLVFLFHFLNFFLSFGASGCNLVLPNRVTSDSALWARLEGDQVIPCLSFKTLHEYVINYTCM